MSFALQNARRWRNLERIAVSLPYYEAKKDDIDDWIKKINVCSEAICEFKDNTCNEIGNIREIYTDTLQKGFLSVKDLK